MRTRLHNARIWDGLADDYLDAREVMVEDGVIRAVGDDGGDGGASEREIDLGGRTLLPGFIDAHFHAYAASVNIPYAESLPLTYLAHHAAEMLTTALKRGFTTVRDAGGADWGLWRALEDGLIKGPRLFYSCRAISQTGGHGDSRSPHVEPCGCRYRVNLSEVVDGVDAMRAAVRESLRRGATQIKLFVSGGLISPSDPIWARGFSAGEIAAAVDEAGARRTYVMAHAYGADAIRHAVENGVRSIEHGNLLDEAAAALMAERGAFLVPTLIIYDALSRRGPELGLPVVSQEKLREVAERGGEAVRIARAAGVKVGFGTDLLGPLHVEQAREFRMRGAVDRPVDVLRSATSVNAELLNMTGKLGVVAPDAFADLVAVDGDPLADLSAIYDRPPALVLKAGEVVADTRAP